MMELKKAKVSSYTRKPASGTEIGNGIRQVAVRFEPEIFSEIRDNALQNGHSFAEQVRIYVGYGMDFERRLVEAVPKV